jgi:hypothetical protein
MPGKSRHGKGKHGHISKKSRARQRQGITPLSQTAADNIPQPAVTTSTPSSPKIPAPPTRLKAVQYPYITTELRRIGILAGIILVILVVLALVLS